jgi:hypothetical protein
LPDTLTLGNGIVELGIPTAHGPRVAHYGFAGEPNVFGDGAGAQRATPRGTWRAHGGHRLWAAPERFPDSYTIDDDPPRIETDGARRALLRQARDPLTGLTKTLELELRPESTEVLVRHTLANDGDAPRRIACWGITVVRPGGAALIPNVVPAPQPEALLPARALALWRYSDLSDPRVAFGPRFTRLRCDPAHATPNKLGAACERGWFAYLNRGTAFVVRAAYDATAEYPDLGSSVEVYTEGGFCEVETLGPLATVPPGGSVSHVARWSLARVAADDDGALAEVLGKHLAP